jgi:hypothetical protein
LVNRWFIRFFWSGFLPERATHGAFGIGGCRETLNSGGEIVGFRRATFIGLVKEPDRPAVRLTQAGSIKRGLPVLLADIRIVA